MLRSAFALSLLVLLCFFVGCQKDPAQHEPLARQYCGGCHLFPDPNLLPKTVWEKDVLPYMALRLGLDEDLKKIRKLNANDLKVKAAHPLISQEDWQKIKDYYLDLAPKRLTPLVSSQKATLIEKQFEIRPLFSPIEQEMANVTCVRIDEANQGVYVADEVNRTVWLMDAEGKAVKRFGGQPAVSDLQFLDASHQNLLVTYIGETVKVTYNANGYAQTVNMGQKVRITPRCCSPSCSVLPKPFSMIWTTTVSPNLSLVSLGSLKENSPFGREMRRVLMRPTY